MSTTPHKLNAASDTNGGSGAKRMALYARVSTDEQTKGNYPSCRSQLEELEDECRRRGWQPYRSITDEGYSAGTMKRPGLSQLRMMVQGGEIDGVICTWYDRLTRSRDFYVLDSEFRSQGVEFVTLHDATNTRTAAGRFMESMLVAAKTYDREQTGEKVRTKMRMRLEKGLHQGGLVPFGFLCDPTTKLLTPDPDKIAIIEQLFRVYVDTRSEFKVRDWLKAHNISTPRDKTWQVSTIGELLCNRRYIGEIEINRKNKGIEELPESETYRVVKADYKPMIPVELFEMALAIRKEHSARSPRRHGGTRTFSQTRHGRIYPLQGLMTCGVCGSPMSPNYVYHRPGSDQRRREGFVYYYVCTQYHRQGRECSHANRVLAANAEEWMLERIRDLVFFDGVADRVVERAIANCHQDQRPLQESIARTQGSLRENQQKIDTLVETITSGTASADLMVIMNEKAGELRRQREELRNELHRLSKSLVPIEDSFDVGRFRSALSDFEQVSRDAAPERLHKLLRLTVKNIKWQSDGTSTVDYYLPLDKMQKPISNVSADRFDINVRSGGPDRTRTGDLLRDRQAC